MEEALSLLLSVTLLKAALTDLFNEVRTDETLIIVERVVSDIDEIVRLVRFPGWHGT